MSDISAPMKSSVVVFFHHVVASELLLFWLWRSMSWERWYFSWLLQSNVQTLSAYKLNRQQQFDGNVSDIPLPNTVSNPGLIGQSFNDKVCMMPHSPQLYELMYEDIVTNYDENTGATETKQKEVGDAAFTTCTSFEDIAIESELG